MRLSRLSSQFMRVLGAKKNHRYMKTFLNAAHWWSLTNGRNQPSLLNPQSNKRKICVAAVDRLNNLSDTLDCTRSEAVYSAINIYPSHIEGQ